MKHSLQKLTVPFILPSKQSRFPDLAREEKVKAYKGLIGILCLFLLCCGFTAAGKIKSKSGNDGSGASKTAATQPAAITDPAIGVNYTFSSCNTSNNILAFISNGASSISYDLANTGCDGNGFTATISASGASSTSNEARISLKSQNGVNSVSFNKTGTASVTYGQIASTSGVEFDLTNIALTPNSNSNQTITLTGFKNGSSTGTYSFSYVAGTTVATTQLPSSTLGSNFTDIDEVQVSTNLAFGVNISDIQTTAPVLPPTTITSLTKTGSSPTNASSVAYTATFAASVSGLSASDFSLTTSGVSGASVGTVSGSGTSWTVNVNTGSGDGSITLKMSSSSGVSPSVSNVSFTGDTYTIDKTAPTIGISSPSASITSSSSVTYTVTYADANFNSSTLAPGNITLTGSGASGTIGVTGSGTTRTVTISGITGNGTLGISIAAGTATDLAGNSAPASGASTTFTVDNTAPTIGISSPSASITSSSSVTYTVTYADANFNSSTLAPGNITLTGSGASGTIGVTGSGTTRTVTISGITGNGTLGISIAAGTATDLAGNSAPASGASTTFTVDNTAPTIGISSPSASITSSSSVTYTVTYADANFNSSTLAPGNITLTGSGASGTIGVTGSGTTRTVTISGITGNGTLGISIAAGTATDLAGNSAPASGASTTFTVDNTAPTIGISSPSVSNTNTGPVTYTVTYADANFNSSTLAPGNITLTGSGASGTIGVTGSGTTRTVTISSITGNGTLGISIAAGTATDLAGNSAPASGVSTTFTVDNTAPTFTSLVYLSNNAHFNYAKVGDVVTLTFGTDEAIQTPVLSIAGHSITATNTGGNNYSASYTLTSGDTEGRVPYNLTVTDLAGNSANETDVAAGDLITFDMTPPTIAIGSPSVSSIISATGSVSYTVTYADANFNTSTLSTGDITLIKTGSANGTVGLSGAGTSYTVTISGITGAGTLGISIGAGTASDLAGNTAPAPAASSTFNVVYSTDATLSGLGVSNNSITPVFDPATTTYGLVVSAFRPFITVTPTTNDPNATVTVNGQAVTSGSPSQDLPMSIGDNPVTIVVTAQDNSTIKTYNLTVTKIPSNNATIANLELSHGSLSPLFVPGGNSYTSTVPNTISSITVTPRTADTGARVTVNGTAVVSNTASSSIGLNVGQNTITVVGIAQDGTTKDTYTVVVTRSASTNDALTSLTLSPASPLTTVAGPDYKDYTTTVNNSVGSIQVTPVTAVSTSMVTVNTVGVTSGTASDPITLNVGSNTITVVVTAEDGSSTKTYVISVTRSLPNNANLTSLKLTNPVAVKTTVAGPDAGDYTASVSNATTSIEVTPTTAVSTSIVTVNNVTVASGSASAPIALSVGDNTITTVVTAQDGVTTKTYVITVTRATGPLLNTIYQQVSVSNPTDHPQMMGEEINVHQGLSPNGDGINDFLLIDGITKYPENKLTIMNRSGVSIFEAKGYDNSNKVFDGHSNKNGAMQLPGTYFYSLEYAVNGITKYKTGFIVLKY
jgi:gliding motility-associated-like protein